MAYIRIRQHFFWCFMAYKHGRRLAVKSEGPKTWWRRRTQHVWVRRAKRIFKFDLYISPKNILTNRVWSKL